MTTYHHFALDADFQCIGRWDEYTDETGDTIGWAIENYITNDQRHFASEDECRRYFYNMGAHWQQGALCTMLLLPKN